MIGIKICTWFVTVHVTHGENLNILPYKLIKTTPERHKESALTFHVKTEQAILVDDL